MRAEPVNDRDLAPNKGRPAGVLANEIIKIFDRRNPHPLEGIPRGEDSRQLIAVLLDDLARAGDVDRMRRLARGFAPWLGDHVIGEMIEKSLANPRRWNTSDELKELSELFQLSEMERDCLGIRQIRPVHPDGSAFNDADMQVRRRVAKKIAERERRQKEAAKAQDAAAADMEPTLSKTERWIFSKIDLTWRSTTAIAKAAKRGHQYHYEGRKTNLVSVRRAVARAAETLAAAGLVERDDTRRGGNGQPLRYLRRLIVHADSVALATRQKPRGQSAKSIATPRHAESAEKKPSLKLVS